MPGTFLVHGQGKKIAKGTDAALGQADGVPAFTHLQAGKMHARACVFKAFGGLKPGQIAQGQAFRLDDIVVFSQAGQVRPPVFPGLRQDGAGFAQIRQKQSRAWGQVVFQAGAVRVENAGQKLAPALGQAGGKAGGLAQFKFAGEAQLFPPFFGLNQKIAITGRGQRGQQGKFSYIADGTLSGGLEQAYLLQGIAKKFQTQGVAVAGRENIQNIAAPGDFSRLGNQGRTQKTPIHGLINNQLRGVVRAASKLKAQLRQHAGWRIFGQQAVQAGHHAGRKALALAQRIQGGQPGPPGPPAV